MEQRHPRDQYWSAGVRKSETWKPGGVIGVIYHESKINLEGHTRNVANFSD
jgi:hypothetical protein